MQKTALAARTEMLIRRPVADVFDSFVDPCKTSKFWFTSGSGRLEAGKRVQWSWDMYDLEVDVDVKALEPRTRAAGGRTCGRSTRGRWIPRAHHSTKSLTSGTPPSND